MSLQKAPLAAPPPLKLPSLSGIGVPSLPVHYPRDIPWQVLVGTGPNGPEFSGRLGQAGGGGVLRAR